MSTWSQPQSGQALAGWQGDARALCEQLGLAEGLAWGPKLAGSLGTAPVTSLPVLREYLHNYRQEILLPHELPAIRTAFELTRRNEMRELIAFDQQLAQEPVLQQLAAASCRVGQAQLQKLRPLRDERGVQRYRTAVEQREAHGWHTMVYGLTLAVYARPLRQGLLDYALQATPGFLAHAVRTLHLTASESRTLTDEFWAPLPAAIGTLIGNAAAS